MPPCPCTIGFGRPGGARGKQNPQRVIERHLLEPELRCAGTGGAFMMSDQLSAASASASPRAFVVPARE